MPYPFAAGDTITDLNERLNEAVAAANAYTDQRAQRTTGIYTLTAPQTILKDTETTIPNFYLNEAVSAANIVNYISLNTDAGRGVWTFLISGYYHVYMKTQWEANTTGHRYIYPRIDNVTVDTKSAPPGNGALLTLDYDFPSLWFNAGQNIRIRVKQNADPADLDLMGAPGSYATQMFFEFQGAM